MWFFYLALLCIEQALPSIVCSCSVQKNGCSMALLYFHNENVIIDTSI